MEKMTDFDTEQEKCICLKKACYEYAKEHFRGKTFFNINRQTFINVSKRGLDEWYSKSKSLEQIISICHLDEILKFSVYTHSAENEHKKDRSRAFFDYYECCV